MHCAAAYAVLLALDLRLGLVLDADEPVVGATLDREKLVELCIILVVLFMRRGAARRHVEAELTGNYSLDLVDRARVLVSELVTNAIVHGQGAPCLAMEQSPRSVYVAVADDGPPLDGLTRRSDGSRGCGLRLLESLADQWGLQSKHDDGKRCGSS